MTSQIEEVEGNKDNYLVSIRTVLLNNVGPTSDFIYFILTKSAVNLYTSITRVIKTLQTAIST